jgi:hypothetical protein
MDWKAMLAYISDSVNEELLLRNETYCISRCNFFGGKQLRVV